MALQWVLRNPVVSSALIGASRPSQLDENIKALDSAPFDAAELAAIDALSDSIDVNKWAVSSDL